eukprot:s2218_g15.t16
MHALVSASWHLKPVPFRPRPPASQRGFAASFPGPCHGERPCTPADMAPHLEVDYGTLDRETNAQEFVTGGHGKGGLLVREGRILDSCEVQQRLATGALIEELQLQAGRLRYRLLAGFGPEEGWVRSSERFEVFLRTSRRSLQVSISLKGRALAQRVCLPSRETLEDACFQHDIKPMKAATELELFRLLADLDVPLICPSFPDASTAAWLRYRCRLSLRVHPDRCPGDVAAASRFLQLTQAKDFLLDPYQRRAFNEAHGFLTPTVNVAWWSDWDEIFGEIEPDPDLPAPPSVPAGLPDPRIDILILGATGITGTLACMVMRRQMRGRSWAIAGRSGRRLQMLEHKFGQGCFQCSLRVESRHDLERVVGTARVVLDCTGPSHDIGVAVAEACVKTGTHLIDFQRTIRAIYSSRKRSKLAAQDKLHGAAKAAGVCLLLHAGYVSVPTDFGVWQLVRGIKEETGADTKKVDVYTYTQGFVMSGTSLLTGTKTTFKDLHAAGAPFVLGGMRSCGVRTEDRADPPHKDENSFMIAYPGLNVDRQVVRGTCGLMDAVEPYGENFLFKDWFLVVDKRPEEMTKQESAQASRLSGIGVSLGGGLGHSLMVEAKKIPPPGWGPKERIRQETFVTKVFVGIADAANEEKMHIVMNAGPGGVGDRYEGTAAMMIEAACCLLDTADQGGDLRSGWGTPVYHLAHLGFYERLVSLGFAFHCYQGAPTSDFMQRVQHLRHVRRVTASADRKKLFKELQLRWHPDKNVGDEVHASEIPGAMSTLLKAVPSLCRADAGAKCLVVRNSQADARLACALEEIEVCQPKFSLSPLVSRFVILQSRACLKEVLNEVRNLRGEDLYLQMRQARTSSLLSINERQTTDERSGSMVDLEDGMAAGDATQSLEAASCGTQGLEMEADPSRNAMIRHTAAAAVMAFVITGLLSISPIDTNVASLMAAIFSLLLNFVALAYAWTHQLSWIFLALNGAVGRLLSSLDEPVDCYGSKLVEPIEKLESAVDMVEMEQAMMVKRMQDVTAIRLAAVPASSGICLKLSQEYEKDVKERVPDFDVPSTRGMREPIVECAGRISNFLEEAKAALPDQVEEQIQTLAPASAKHRLGSLVARRSAFDCWLVQVPLILFLLVNLSGLICSQILATDVASALASAAPAPPSPDKSLEALAEATIKRGLGLCPCMAPPTSRFGFDCVVVLPVAGKALVVFLPWLIQLILAWVELLAGLYFTRAPRLMALVGSVTADVERSCNTWLDKQGKGIPAEVFATFGKVQKQADSFFPAFRQRVGQLEEYLRATAKANKQHGLFGRASGSKHCRKAKDGFCSRNVSGPHPEWSIQRHCDLPCQDVEVVDADVDCPLRARCTTPLSPMQDWRQS